MFSQQFACQLHVNCAQIVATELSIASTHESFAVNIAKNVAKVSLACTAIDYHAASSLCVRCKYSRVLRANLLAHQLSTW